MATVCFHNILWWSVEDCFRKILLRSQSCRKEAALVERQQIRLCWLPEGTRVSKLWLAWVFSFSVFWAMQRHLTSPISVMFWCFYHLLQSSPELCASHEFVFFSIRMLSIALLSFFTKVYMCDVHYRFSVMLISKNLKLFIHSTSAFADVQRCVSLPLFFLKSTISSFL